MAAIGRDIPSITWRNQLLLWATIVLIFIQSRAVSAQINTTDIPSAGVSTVELLTAYTTGPPGATPPPILIDCPANISWPIFNGQLEAQVNWSEPAAVHRNESFGSDGISVVRPIKGPGSFFFIVENHVIQYLFQYMDAQPIVCEFPILFTIIEDTEEPEVVCPPDIRLNVPFGQTVGLVSWSDPTATDNSGVVFLVDASHSQDTPFPVGATNVTYTYADPSDLTNSCTFSVVIVTLELDTEPPNIRFCPDEDITVKALSSEEGANVTWRTPEVTDNSGNVTLTSIAPDPGSFFVFGVTVIGYIYADRSNNFAHCVFSIQVTEVPDEDNPCRSSPCQVGLCELDFSEDGYRCICDVGFSGDNCDVCLKGSLVDCPNRTAFEVATGERTRSISLKQPFARFEDRVDTDIPLEANIDIREGFPVGLTKFSYKAGCLKCVANIIIEDTTPPVIEDCPNNITDVLDEDEEFKPISWDEPNVTDYQERHLINCSSHVPGDLFGMGISRVTYNYTDDARNMAMCSFTIQLLAPETASPPIILNCPVNGIHAFGMDVVSVLWKELEVSNRSEVSVNSTHLPGDEFVVGVTQVNYKVIDIFGNIDECNFTVTVTETSGEPYTNGDTSRFIECPPTLRVFAPEDNNGVDDVRWPQPKFSHTSSSSFLRQQTHYPGERFPIGETVVKYTAMNSETGAQIFCSFNVTVMDVHAPVFINCPTPPRVRACRGSVTSVWQLPMAIDNSMKGVVIQQIKEAIPGRTRFPQGRTLVSYTATDDSSNLAVCRFAIEVHNDDCSPIPTILFSFAAGFVILLILTYLAGSTLHFFRQRRRRRMEVAAGEGVAGEGSGDTDRIIEDHATDDRGSESADHNGTVTPGDGNSLLQITMEDEITN